MDKLAALYRPLVWLDEEILAPSVGLALRLWVAYIFFK